MHYISNQNCCRKNKSSRSWKGFIDKGFYFLQKSSVLDQGILVRYIHVSEFQCIMQKTWRTKYVENKKPVKHVGLNSNWVFISYINLTTYIKSMYERDN